MITGIVEGGYAFWNVIQFAQGAKFVPPMIGDVPMAFSTSVLFVIQGVAMFWIGYLFRRDEAYMRPSRDRGLTGAQMVQLLMAVISAGALIVVALIGLFRK